MVFLCFFLFSAASAWQTKRTAHSSPHGTDVGGTDGAGNVIVAGGNVCGQRPQGVEWCLAPQRIEALYQWGLMGFNGI